MAALWTVIRTLLYPEHAGCAGCGAMRVDRTEWGLCEPCAQRLEAMHAPEEGLHGTAVLQEAYCPYPYAGIVKTLVRALKYNSVIPAANALADGMASSLPSGAYDVLVPVPLYRTRQRQRGFNQAEVLCQALSARTGIPVLDALTRVRHTHTQTHLTREGRAENVRDAFLAEQAVAELSVVLVDDVLTTGATAEDCARALREAGARNVVLLTAARG